LPDVSPGSAFVSLAAVVLVLGLAAAFVKVATIQIRERSKGSACESNLQQIGLAAIQYCDDKRFYPHVRAIRERDGDATTNEGPRALRSLLYFTYLEDPAVFCCPESADEPAKLNEAARAELRRFGWNGGTESGAPPIAVAGEHDRPLAETKDLSYGWMREAHGGNAIHGFTVCGDRASCNHAGSFCVVINDASTHRIRAKNDSFECYFNPPGSDVGTTDRLYFRERLDVLAKDPHAGCGPLTRSERLDRVELAGIGVLTVVAFAVFRRKTRRAPDAIIPAWTSPSSTSSCPKSS
jgi:hypothetical protein